MLLTCGLAQAGRIFHDWAQLPITREEFLAKQAPLQEKYFSKCRPLPGVRVLLEGLAKARTRTRTRTGMEMGMGMATGAEESKEAEAATTPAPAKHPQAETREQKWPEEPKEKQEDEALQVHLALATSSHRGNFSLKTSHMTDLFDVFAPERRILGDDPRIPKGRGKPAPDIYLQALKTINEGIEVARMGDEFRQVVEGGEGHVWGPGGELHHLRPVLPEECLVFEDSVPGVEAGRRAGMQVVWCPHPGLLKEYEGKEELVLAGLAGQHVEEGEEKDTGKEDGEQGDGALEYLVCEWLDRFFSNDEINRTKAVKLGRPGKIGDGWARLLSSLENFPYEHYGIKV